MVKNYNTGKSLFTSAVSGPGKSTFGTMEFTILSPFVDANIVLAASRGTGGGGPGDVATTLVDVNMYPEHRKVIQEIHDLYTLQLASRKYDKIPKNYDQYLTLLYEVQSMTASSPILKLLLNIIESTLTGAMNVIQIYESSTYNELQILLLNNRIEDILSNKNNKNVIADEGNIKGQFSVEKVFKLSKIYSYYIRIYGMPEFGVGFDPNKLTLLKNVLDDFELTYNDDTMKTDPSGNIAPLPELQITQFPMDPNTLQVVIPAQVFNEKVGIHKYNGRVEDFVHSYYDLSNHNLLTDSITITAKEFATYINSTEQVISVGGFQTFYSDFNTYVAVYFGVAKGTTDVFDASSVVDIMNRFLNPYPDNKNAVNMAGNITISNLTQIIRNAVRLDPFQNRNTTSGYFSGTNDISPYRFSVEDGFYPGDTFYIPENGFSLTMDVFVDTQLFQIPMRDYFNTIGTETDLPGVVLQRPNVTTPLLIVLGPTLSVDISGDMPDFML